jgi:hypothetical protein
VILVLQWIVYRLDIEVVALLMCRNKRPEFTAWLLEVKKVNLESLPPWEEKKMFKEYVL